MALARKKAEKRMVSTLKPSSTRRAGSLRRAASEITVANEPCPPARELHDDQRWVYPYEFSGCGFGSGN